MMDDFTELETYEKKLRQMASTLAVMPFPAAHSEHMAAMVALHCARGSIRLLMERKTPPAD